MHRLVDEKRTAPLAVAHRRARSRAPEALLMPLQDILVAEAQRRIHRAAHNADSSARPLVAYFVGLVVAQMHVPTSIRDVVRETVEQCIDAMERTNGLLMDE